MNSCDNCKYEPDYGPVRGRYPYVTKVGMCKKKIDIPVLPSCYASLFSNNIVRYEDDGSGVHHNCKTWEAKEKDQ